MVLHVTQKEVHNRIHLEMRNEKFFLLYYWLWYSLHHFTNGFRHIFYGRI